MKIDKFKLKKIVLGTVRGGQFLNISLKFDYKYNSWLLQCFSLSFLIPFYLLLFILSSSFISTLHMQLRSLVLILVSSAPSWNLWVVAIRLKVTVQVSLPHQCGQRVSCRAFNAVVAAFPWDISWHSFVLFLSNTYPHSWNDPECYSWWQTTLSDLGFAQPRRDSSSDHPSRRT